MLDEFFNLAYVRNWKQAIAFFAICTLFFGCVMMLVRVMIGMTMQQLGYSNAEALQRSWFMTQEVVIVLGPFFSFIIIRAKGITGLAMVTPLIAACLLSWFNVPGAMVVPAFLTTRKVVKPS